jgi:hypothetical protein
MVDLESNALTLRASTALRARRSLVFFAKHALGLRVPSSARLLELEAGASPTLRFEEDLLRRWREFRTGDSVPEELRWCVGDEAAGGGAA